MQKQITITYEDYASSHELSKEDEQLIDVAVAGKHLAYAPYSEFKVGAAARLSDGTIATGANLENASYGVTNCAERVLLGNILVNNPDAAIKTLAISCSHSKYSIDEILSPCGICRQALHEHETRFRTQIRLILTSQNGNCRIINGMSQLLPFAFSLPN